MDNCRLNNKKEKKTKTDPGSGFGQLECVFGLCVTELADVFIERLDVESIRAAD